jgi:hypothetical protein
MSTMSPEDDTGILSVNDIHQPKLEQDRTSVAGGFA